MFIVVIGQSLINYRLYCYSAAEYLFYLLIYPKCLEKGLPYSRYLINIYGIDLN